MLLYRILDGYETLPEENVEYARIENRTYAPEFIIDGIHYTTVNLMESYRTFGEENAHHILVADVVSNQLYSEDDGTQVYEHKLTIDYHNKKIIIETKY